MDFNSYKPKGVLNQKHLLTLRDYSKEDIFEIFALTKKLKDEYKAGKTSEVLKNKTLAMIFSKSSTRTRLSFEMGMKQLGGDSIFLSTSDIQLGRNETIADTAKVLARMGLAGVMIRTYAQSDIVELAENGGIPVINGLTDDYHPCQALADVYTLWEKKGKIAGAKIAFCGDGNNVASSLMIISAKLGIEFACVCPDGYRIPDEILNYCKSIGGNVYCASDVNAGVKNADVVYTDVFFSMGQNVSDEKRNALMPFQVNKELFSKAKKDAVFMHCLPAHRGDEVTAEIMDGEMSVVFDEAENRMHTQKAVLVLLLGK